MIIVGISEFMLFGQGGFTNNSWLSMHSGAGYVIPEYSNINYSVTDPIQSINVSWNKRTTGKRLTEQLYHFPEYGISAGFSNLGNKEVFGHELSLYPYFRTFFLSGGTQCVLSSIWVWSWIFHQKIQLNYKSRQHIGWVVP